MSKEWNKLLSRYYSGNTSLEEEKEIKDALFLNDEDSVEKDMFRFFNHESKVPEGLENELNKLIDSQSRKKRSLKVRLYSFTSAAAVILVVLSVFLNIRNNKIRAMEDQFFEMERAMLQVSESLQTEEPEEMMVLWVDENVEIIIN